MASLEKRPDGGFSIVYTKPDGRRGRVSITRLAGHKVEDRKEADKIYAKWVTRNIITEYSPVPREALSDLANRYDQFVRNRWTEETYRVGMPRLRSFIAWAQENGCLYADQVKPLLIEDYRQKLLDGGAQPVTANRHLEIVRSFFNRLRAWRLIDQSPVENLEMQKVHKQEMRILTDAELQMLLVSAKADPDLYDVIFLAVQTGMRRGEIARLRWFDVKEDGIHLPITKSFRPRTIPFAEGVRGMLDRRRDARRPNTSYVFDQDDNKPITGNVWYHRLRDQYAKLGIVGADFHTLRHTFASRLIRSGANVKVVQSLMGHADIATTMQYVHLYEGDLRRAIEALTLPEITGRVVISYAPMGS